QACLRAARLSSGIPRSRPSSPGGISMVLETLRLDGPPRRVAIVTGGGRGLGRAMAKALADAGARVVLAAPDSDTIEAAAKSINESCGRNCAFAITADITSAQDCQRVLNESVSRFGGLHVLVNNARRLQRGP